MENYISSFIELKISKLFQFIEESGVFRQLAALSAQNSAIKIEQFHDILQEHDMENSEQPAHRN